MRRLARVALGLGLATGCLTAEQPASAQVPPWVSPKALPLPDGIQSARVERREVAIYTAPDRSAPRRGSTGQGHSLPLFGARYGSGCEQRWLLVGPGAWLCSDEVVLSAAPPVAAQTAPRHYPEGLPLPYFFVREDGAMAFARFSDIDNAPPFSTLEPNFVVAISQTAKSPSGDPFGLTKKGLWISMGDLRAARKPDFAGVELGDKSQGFGWTFVERARVHEAPDKRHVIERLPLRTPVAVLEERERRGVYWVRIGERRWVRGKDLRVHRPAESPHNLRPEEHWVDVDTETQILTLYEGDTAVFATLVSTGRGAPGTELATPRGVHRIWVKLVTSDMTNLEDEDAGRYYAIEDVPWVMYFQGGYGLHGAFWHHSFGRVRSHGCVNLTPRDAERVFHWTGPRLPTGWTAVLPTEYDQGSLVVVR